MMAPCSTRWPASSPGLPSWRHGPCQLERCGVAGSRRRTPAWEEDVKPNNRLLVEGVLALASAGALGCENPVASDRPRPQTAVAVAAADRLPDLRSEERRVGKECRSRRSPAREQEISISHSHTGIV